MTILERIKQYLATGGLFNPEMANHEVVRDLLMDCRDYVAELENALAELADLMEDVRHGDYKPDSFTIQPARDILSRGGDR